MITKEHILLAVAILSVVAGLYGHSKIANKPSSILNSALFVLFIWMVAIGGAYSIFSIMRMIGID